MARRSGSDGAPRPRRSSPGGGRARQARATNPCAVSSRACGWSRAIDDADAVVDGTIWLINLLARSGCASPRPSRLVGSRSTRSRRLGGRHWSLLHGSDGRRRPAHLGRFEEARDLLRQALAIRCVGVPGVATRLVATRLACRTGDTDGGATTPRPSPRGDGPRFGGLVGGLIGTRGRAAPRRGRPARGVGLDLRNGSTATGIRRTSRASRSCGPARALADLGRTARDADDAARRAQGCRPSSRPGRSGWRLSPHRVDRSSVQRPGGARAHRGRDRPLSRDADETELWQRAVAVCRRPASGGTRPCALVRLIETHVRRGPPGRCSPPWSARPHRHAVDMGAGPLPERSEQLARVSRVSLVEPSRVPRAPGPARSIRASSLDGPGARGSRASRRGTHQRRDRPRPGDQRQDGQRARLQHPAQDGYVEPGRGRRLGGETDLTASYTPDGSETTILVTGSGRSRQRDSAECRRRLRSRRTSPTRARSTGQRFAGRGDRRRREGSEKGEREKEGANDAVHENSPVVGFWVAHHARPRECPSTSGGPPQIPVVTPLRFRHPCRTPSGRGRVVADRSPDDARGRCRRTRRPTARWRTCR